MKLNFRFDFSAESGKLVKNDVSGEIGQINCPIAVELELDPSEIQQTIGLLRDLAKEVPALIKQHHEDEIDIIERKAKLDEHIAQVRYQLEADNIRLKADLADKSKEQKPATTKSKKQTEPNAFEVFDHT